MSRTLRVLLCFAVGSVALAAEGEVSYYNDIRPLIQRSCSGCHQPANKMSELVLTDYAGILKGGLKNGPAVKQGAPDDSALIAYVTGVKEPRMPMGGEALPAEHVDLLREWIRQGAADDTPAEARAPQVPSEPPVYTQPPVVTAVAYSPDGQLLAVGGYHEILLHKADGSALVARLLGRSEKIHRLLFTPDGSTLIAVGGAPARFGEIQIWDLAERKLRRSILAGTDTLFGGALSPDGARVVAGSSDKSLRMFDLESGKELFKAGHHEDWVLDTAFGIDGKRVVSVGRDRAAKLADAGTGAFAENVNLLRDMLYVIARHPRRDYVLIGGEERIPYLYTMDRPRAIKIADDSTLVRRFDEQPGEIFALAFNPDGSRFAVGGIGDEAAIYDTGSGKRTAVLKGGGGGVFTFAFQPDATRVAAAGFDGMVRIYDAESGELVNEFPPAPIEETEKSSE